MLAKKKKISRKDIKQDVLVTFYYKAVQFVNNQKKYLSIGIGAVAIIVVGIVLFVNSRKKGNEQASADLSQVITLYNQSAYQDAIDGKQVQALKIKGLKKIVDENGSTESGETAKIYLANSYYNLKQYDLALKTFDSYGGGIDHLKAASIAGMAACYEAKNEIEKAAEYYLKASKVSQSNVLNAQYLLSAGINFIETGKNDDAKDALKSIKKNYPKSESASQVERYLLQVE